ncbi:hypothetical protein ABZP36_029459 [Zizania latifolia]
MGETLRSSDGEIGTAVEEIACSPATGTSLRVRGGGGTTGKARMTADKMAKTGDAARKPENEKHDDDDDDDEEEESLCLLPVLCHFRAKLLR